MVISGIIVPLIWVIIIVTLLITPLIIIVTLLITPLITTHELP